MSSTPGEIRDGYGDGESGGKGETKEGEGGTKVVYGSLRNSDIEEEEVGRILRRFHYLRMNEGGRWRVVMR